MELGRNQNEHAGQLSEAGAEGWELVAVAVRTFGVMAYLKRRAADAQ
jgi:hypothetical protein